MMDYESTGEKGGNGYHIETYGLYLDYHLFLRKSEIKKKICCSVLAFLNQD